MRPEDFVALARDLDEADAREYGPSGPAIVIVSAPTRDEGEAILVQAFTVTKGQVRLYGGRGLAVVDAVEAALRSLPGEHLPPLLVTTERATLPATMRDNQLSIWASAVRWPPAEPGEPEGHPIDTATGDGLSAIRDHIADAVVASVPLLTQADVDADADLQDRFDADQDRIGDTEARRRRALIEGLVPRVSIDMHTYREVVGGQPDLAVIAAQTFSDEDGRNWSARAATQSMIATVTVCHRTERLADEVTRDIAAGLDDSSVIWPGSFDAIVEDSGGDLVTVRRTNGTYAQLVRLLMRDPATWDDEKGLAVAKLEIAVSAVSLLSVATETIEPDTLTVTPRFRFPV